MKTRTIVEDAYRVVACLNGDRCAVEEFLGTSDANYVVYAKGLRTYLAHVARLGLQGIPAIWWHEAGKGTGIYEFKKGALRLYFFKGRGCEVVVCTHGIVKKRQQTLPEDIKAACRMKKAYEQMCDN